MTDEERRLVEAAVASGRVTRVPQRTAEAWMADRDPWISNYDKKRHKKAREKGVAR